MSGMAHTERKKATAEQLAPAIFSKMERFIDDGERTAPLAFVGRETVLSDLMRGVARAGEGRAKSGMTRVVEGIPGSGKTSIIKKFIDRHQGEEILAEGGERLRLFAIEMPGASLDTTPLQFARMLSEEWKDYCREGMAGKKEEARKHMLEIADLGRVTMQRDTETEVLTRMRGLTDRSNMASCLNAYLGDDIIVAVCIDEAQEIPATRDAKNILQTLHLATHKGRCAAFCFGLHGTIDKLAELGLSRINRKFKHKVELLEPGQSRQVAVGSFDQLGLSWKNAEWRKYAASRGFTAHTWGRVREKLEDVVAEGSSDFPQHITLGIASVCEELLKRRSTLTPGQTSEVLRSARENHGKAKTDYYQERLSGLESHGASFGAICRAAGESPSKSITSSDAIEAISAGCSKRKTPLTEEQSEEILERALRKGCLARTEKGRISVPKIPSITTFLEEFLQEDLDLDAPHAIRAVKALAPPAPTKTAERAPDPSGRPKARADHQKRENSKIVDCLSN